MKTLLLTISTVALLLAGQTVIASDAHDKNVVMPIFVENINAVEDDVSVRKVIYIENKDRVNDPSYDAKSDITSLEYENDD